MVILSIVICTRNRFDLLIKGIKHLLNLECNEIDAEIIVVDNGSDDGTKEAIKKLQRNTDKIVYCYEENIGLSHARNAGVRLARGDWICFLDDDGFVNSDFYNRISITISENLFDCVGGKFIPYFDEKEPKWFPEYYEVNLTSTKRGHIVEGDEIWGGIMIFKRKVFNVIGGFNVELGPIGDQTGYGDDSELIERLKAEELVLGVDPEWILNHLVRKDQMKITWHYYRHFALGRDGVKYKNEYPFSKVGVIIGFLIRVPIAVVKGILLSIYTPKLFYNRIFYVIPITFCFYLGIAYKLVQVKCNP